MYFWSFLVLDQRLFAIFVCVLFYRNKLLDLTISWLLRAVLNQHVGGDVWLWSEVSFCFLKQCLVFFWSKYFVVWCCIWGVILVLYELLSIWWRAKLLRVNNYISWERVVYFHLDNLLCSPLFPSTSFLLKLRTFCFLMLLDFVPISSDCVSLLVEATIFTQVIISNQVDTYVHNLLVVLIAVKLIITPKEVLVLGCHYLLRWYSFANLVTQRTWLDFLGQVFERPLLWYVFIGVLGIDKVVAPLQLLKLPLLFDRRIRSDPLVPCSYGHYFVSVTFIDFFRLLLGLWADITMAWKFSLGMAGWSKYSLLNCLRVHGID